MTKLLLSLALLQASSVGGTPPTGPPSGNSTGRAATRSRWGVQDGLKGGKRGLRSSPQSLFRQRNLSHLCFISF